MRDPIYVPKGAALEYAEYAINLYFKIPYCIKNSLKTEMMSSPIASSQSTCASPSV